MGIKSLHDLVKPVEEEVSVEEIKNKEPSEEYKSAVIIIEKSKVAVEHLKDILTIKEESLKNSDDFDVNVEKIARIALEHICSELQIKEEKEDRVSLEAFEEDPDAGLLLSIEQLRNTIKTAEDLIESAEKGLEDLK